MQFGSRIDPHRPQPEQRSPVHTDNAKSPIIFSEMTTIRTDVLTAGTTETATRLSSRMRTAPPSPILLHESPDRSPSYFRRDPKSMPSLPLLNKALPPTPPHDLREPRPGGGGDSEPSTGSAIAPATSQTDSFFIRTRKTSTGLQAAVALAQAALGIGLPHASTSLSKETSAMSFRPHTSPTPSPMPSPSSVRRVKSSQRIQPRHVSDTHESTNADNSAARRKRGLSFTTTSFLNLMSPDPKGKGKETHPLPTSPKLQPPTLSRKSSFWSRKKSVESGELVTSPSHEETTPTFTIPPVHHLTPFNISEFTVPPLSSSGPSTSSSHATETTNIPFGERYLSRSYNSSPEILVDQVFFPRKSQSRVSSERPATADAAGPPRLRTLTNPPLLHRLSMGFFSASEPSPSLGTRPNSAFPSVNASLHSFPPKLDKRQPIPKPHGADEQPEVYLNRLRSAVSKAEIAGILASSSDSFYSQTLRIYIKQFEFHDIPLDVALRKLLMEVGLPRETQQIDRVMEAFAARYMHCNNVFTSEDHPYILAFSLIMLHTDAFNPSNKRKMSKADYIKNTKLPGVPSEVLDYFFDNIVFAPFIFIEDPVDFNGQLGLNDTIRASAVNTPASALPSASGPGPFKIGNKVDPYYLITNNLLEPLRVDINAFMSLENPFSYEGTDGPWDEHELHEAFLTANIVHVEAPSNQRTLPVFTVGTIGQSPAAGVDPLSSLNSDAEIWNLKLTKVGLLNRKDDTLERGKKSSNRKWKTWSVVLTGSQLLFFRDPTWATSLSQSYDAVDQQAQPPHAIAFKPDESFSLKDAIAVYDRSYTKYKHTMRFVLPDGRQILLQAPSDTELNSWLSRINYASAFKSAGIRMRPLGLSGEDVLLTGVAAATSHLHDLQQHSDTRKRKSWDSDVGQDLMDMLSLPNHSKSRLTRRFTLSELSEFDMDVPVAPEIDGAEQFKATFDQVKADLAASSWSSLDDAPWLSQEEDAENNIAESPPTSPGSSISNSSHLPSRSQIIQSKIRHINSKVHASQAQYDADMRYVRNIAILTPFQKSTRARLSSAIQGVAKRINLVRLDRARLHCHRHVLACDLASEDRSWSRSKQMALRAAKETLQSRCSQNVPTMTLSLLDDTAGASRALASPALPTPESTTCESFYSAQDFGPAWSSKSDSSQKFPLRASASFPLLQYQSQEQMRNSLNSSLTSASGRASSSFDQVDDQRQDSFNHDHTCHGDDEEAEEWNRTKCAQRVSLVHVPSSIMLSRLRGAIDPNRLPG